MQLESSSEQASHNHCLPLEVADIFRAHGKQYREDHPLSIEHPQAMGDIERCRTAALGGHVDVREKDCGYFHITCNSCRNRHCPKCQGLQKARWVEQRLQRLLPTHYFHIVVTLPHELNPLVLYNKALLYRMLFQCASRALLDRALTWKRLGARTVLPLFRTPGTRIRPFTPTPTSLQRVGASMTLEAVGFPRKPTSWFPSGSSRDPCGISEGKISFPDPLSQLSSADAFRRFLGKRGRQKWVVYCKKPFGGPEQFIAYVGRYTHRVAISNHRLLHFSNGRVAFKARDNSDPSKPLGVIVSAEEFIRRFLLHVLPTGFVRIRHYGLMAACNAKTKLLTARELMDPTAQPMISSQSGTSTAELKTPWQELLRRLTGIDLSLCPRCGARTT